MKIYVTGYSGRIGKKLIDYKSFFPLHCDVTKKDELFELIRTEKPDVVVHLAAMSDVDECEKKSRADEVIKMNYSSVVSVAEACQDVGAGMVLLSTDHIFDGKKGPYKEGYKYYIPNILGQFEKPVNFYGLSKIAAEGIQKVFPLMKIVRTSYNFDYDRIFVGDEGVMQQADHPTFFNRSFMYIPHFVGALKVYLYKFYEMPSILHISGSYTVSWYEFMLAVASVFGIDKESIIPRKRNDGNFAPRPKKAGLDVKLSAKLGLPQFSYIDGIKQMRIDAS